MSATKSCILPLQGHLKPDIATQKRFASFWHIVSWLFCTTTLSLKVLTNELWNLVVTILFRLDVNGSHLCLQKLILLWADLLEDIRHHVLKFFCLVLGNLDLIDILKILLTEFLNG